MSRARRGTLRVRAQYGPARRLAQQAIYVMNANGTQKKRLSTRLAQLQGAAAAPGAMGLSCCARHVEVATQRITAIVIAGRHENRGAAEGVLGVVPGPDLKQPRVVVAVVDTPLRGEDVSERVRGDALALDLF
jgi:hypothetical protein